MRVFIQDKQGKMLATMIDGVVYQNAKGDDALIALALFKMAWGLMERVPMAAIDGTPGILDASVEGGTP